MHDTADNQPFRRTLRCGQQLGGISVRMPDQPGWRATK